MYLYLDEIESLGFTPQRARLKTNCHNWPFELKELTSFHRKSTSALMRNLSILSKSRWFLDENGLPTAIAFDLDEGATYIGYEESREDSTRISKAAGVHIQKIEPGADPVKYSASQNRPFFEQPYLDNHWDIHLK